MARHDLSNHPSASPTGTGQRARLAGAARATGHGYHRWVRDMLPCLDQLTAGIAAAHAGRDTRLPTLRDAYRAFERRLRRHLAWEDSRLFPLLAALEQGSMGAAADARHARGELRLGHAELALMLDRLAGLSDGFAAPGWASLDHRLMLDQLRTLAAETRAHLQAQQEALDPGRDEA
jgi:regulator of cell morphogenesis and NO signaling